MISGWVFFALLLLVWLLRREWEYAGLTARFAAREREWRAQLETTEAEWRKREQMLVDRLLRRAKVEPIAHEHERALKWPDPETQAPRNWVDEVVEEGDILEIVYEQEPDLSGYDAAYVRASHPRVWQEAVAQRMMERQPLAVAR